MSSRVQRIFEKYGVDPAEVREYHEQTDDPYRTTHWVNRYLLQSATSNVDASLSETEERAIIDALVWGDNMEALDAEASFARLREIGIDAYDLTEDFIRPEELKQFLSGESDEDAVQAPHLTVESLVTFNHASDLPIENPERGLGTVTVDDPTLTLGCRECGDEWTLEEVKIGTELDCACVRARRS